MSSSNSSSVRLLLPVLLALTGGAGTITAQTTRVWPSGFDSRDGGGAQNAPFTVSASYPDRRTRSMTTMSAASLPFGAGSVLNEIAYRRDSRDRWASYAGSSGGTLAVRLGSVARADRPEMIFGRNWSSPPMIVFEGAFNVPAAGPPGAGTPSFTVTIPFSQAWTYTGGDMAVDLVFAGSPAGTWRRDAVATPTQTNAEFAQVGPGCPGSSGYSAYTYPLVERAVPGKSLVVHLTGAVRPPSSFSLENFAINFLGASATSMESIPLPLDLAPLGFRSGCMLRTDFMAIQVVLTGNPSTRFTRAEVSWPLPPDPAITGGKLYTQWACNDSAIGSPMKLTFSSGCEITIGAAPAATTSMGTTIWKYGAAGSNTESGNVAGPQYVAVTRFGGALR